MLHAGQNWGKGTPYINLKFAPVKLLKTARLIAIPQKKCI